jgi:hypothetical protein
MKLHKSERGNKNLNSSLNSPYLSPPLAMSTKKKANPAEVERWDLTAR